MASFTDKVPTFNPYVSQQPVESMVKVGMMKQQQYDTNLEKIHQSMSNIAGLQIGRDVDKQYLQDKMNSTSKNLSLFAGADLSQNQLTNSLRGMIGGIANDEIIQNSVKSTMNAQQARALQAKYNAEGKGSPSNDYMLNKQLAEWYNNPELGASFNGSYTPYHDYKADSMEIIKNLAKDYTESEVAFDFDERGNIVGVRDAISNTVVEGITPEKIQTALKGGLSPAAWNQIQMDGIYQYSGVSDQTFITSTRERYSSILSNNEEKISRWEKLASNARDASEKQALQTQINGLRAYGKNVEREFNSINDQLNSGNLDGAKAKLFTINWMDNMSESFSSSSVKKTYKTNPFKTVQLQEAKMRQDANIAFAKMRQDDRHFAATYGLGLAKLQLERDKLAAESLEGGQQSRFGNIEVPTKVDKMDNGEYVETVKQTIESEGNSVEQERQALFAKYGWDQEDLENHITARKTGTLSLSVDAKEDLDRFVTMRDAFQAKAKSVVNIENNAEKLFPTQKQKVMTVQQNKVFFAQGQNGESFEFTTAEAIDAFEEFNNKYMTITTPLTKNQDTTVEFEDESAYSDFTEMPGDSLEDVDRKNKMKAMYNVWRDYHKGKGGRPTDGLSFYDNTGNIQDENSIYQHIKNVSRDIAPTVVDQTKQKEDYIAKEMKATNVQFGNKAYGITLKNKEEQDQFFSKVMGPLLETAQTRGIEGVDPEDIQAYMLGYQSSHITTNRNQHILNVVSKDHSDILQIPLEDKTYNQAFKGAYEPSQEMQRYFDKYVPKLLSNVQEVKPVVLSNGDYLKDDYGNTVYRESNPSYWSTATDGKYNTNFGNGSLKQEHGYFSNVEHYTVSANIVSNVSPEQADYVYLKLNVYDPVTGKTYTDLTPGKVAVTQIDNVINMYTDHSIYQLINSTEGSMPQDYYDQLIKASRKLSH